MSEAVKITIDDLTAAAAELRRLHALNAELVEALRLVVEVWFRPHGINYVDFRPYMETARAALAKVEASK